MHPTDIAFPGIWTKLQKTYAPQSTSNSTRIRRLLRTFRALVSITVWSVRNGLRASIAWLLTAREAHTRGGKGHKEMNLNSDLLLYRVKALKDEPYSQKEAEAAIGLRTDNGPRQAAKENTTNVEVEMENSGSLEDSIVT